MKDRRYGTFRIAYSMLENTPSEVRRALAQVIILRAESMFVMNAIEYQAWSEEFDPIPKGTFPPIYDIQFSRNGTIWFEKRDE